MFRFPQQQWVRLQDPESRDGTIRGWFDSVRFRFKMARFVFFRIGSSKSILINSRTKNLHLKWVSSLLLVYHSVFLPPYFVFLAFIQHEHHTYLWLYILLKINVFNSCFASLPMHDVVFFH
jgi:hypothetical protein